ncbi:MAG: ribosome maturation factor RimM [Candidatus Baltobacteraceae bacterium]
MNDDLQAGRIAGLFGRSGELKCDPSSAGRTAFVVGATLRCERDGEFTEVTVSDVRDHKGRLLITFDGCESAEDAQAYIGAVLYVSADEIELEPNEYLDRDLIGCELIASSGASLGTVSAVHHYPTSDMLVIGKSLVPMIHQFIKQISVEQKRITVDLPVGLLDLN